MWAVLSHWLPSNYHCQGLEKYEKHRHAISGSTVTLWSDEKRYSPKWRYGAELLNKVVILVLFPYKKYSHRFITLRLNHWWQMEYPDNVFHTFLDLDSGNYLAVNGTVTSLLISPNILICVPKTTKAFTGLERHGGKWLTTKFSFWGGVSL